jgi:hypothetical protein
MQIDCLNQEQVVVRLAASLPGIDLHMDSRSWHRRSNTTKTPEQLAPYLSMLLVYLSENRLFAQYKSLVQAAQVVQLDSTLVQLDSTLVQMGSTLVQAGSKWASYSMVPHSMGVDNVWR